MEYTRDQKLAHSRNLSQSADWAWCKSEFERIVRLRRMNVNSVVDQNTLFRAGVIAGIEYCLEYPELAFKVNQSITDKIMARVMGDERKKTEKEIPI